MPGIHKGTRFGHTCAIFVVMVLIVPSCLPLSVIGCPAGPGHVDPEDRDEMGPPRDESSVLVPMDKSSLPADMNPHLYHAEAAARWLISIAQKPAAGQYKWYMSDLYQSLFYLELSSGASGIGTFFLELYIATGNQTYLDYAKGAANWIISKAVPVGTDAAKWSFMEGWNEYYPDKFGGVAAIGEFMLALYRVTKDQTYLTYSKKGANYIKSVAEPQNGGYKWELDDGRNFTGWAHGVAGIADFLRMLSIETGDQTYMDYAKGGAQWLIATAISPTPGQYAWVRIEGDPGPEISWCGGTTGIVLFFLKMYETTKNGTYLDYAKGGGNWMISESTTVAPGMTTFMNINMFCHGDPSCSYVLFMLYNLTGNAIYKQYAEESANWTISTGVPVDEDQMKWPSMIGTDYFETGMLRGVAGIGHQMAYSYKITQDERYLGYAIKAANWLENISIEVSPGVEKWNWEERLGADKEFLPGWYYGAAGIGLFLLEMAPFWTPPPPPEVHAVDILGADLEGHARPGEVARFQVDVKNTGNIAESVHIGLEHVWATEHHFDAALLAPGETRTLLVNVTVPTDALAGSKDALVIKAWPAGNTIATDVLSIKTYADAVYGVDILEDDQSGAIPPGGTKSYVIQVRNCGNDVDDIITSTSAAPTGWTMELTFDGSSMAPSGVRTAMMNITAPVDGLAGSNGTVTVTARSQGDMNRTDEILVSTSVDALYGVDILGEDLSNSTELRGTSIYEFVVKNTGNTDDTIELSSTTLAKGWQASLEFDGADMPPGEARTATIIVTAPAFELAWTNMTMTMTARSLGAPDRSDQVLVRTTVLPMGAVSLNASEGARALPGKSVTYAFEVSNDGNYEEDYSVEVASKNGWPVRYINPKAGNMTGPIGSQEAVKVLVETKVPFDAVSMATDILIVTVRADTLSGPTSASASVNTTVEAVRDIQFTSNTTGASLQCLAGSSISFTLIVANKGNADTMVTFKVEAPAVLSVHLSQSALVVPLMATNDTRLTIKLGSVCDWKHPAKGVYTVKVVLMGEGISKELNLTVEILDAKKPENLTGLRNDTPMFILIVIIMIAVLVSTAIYMAVRQSRKGPGDRKGISGQQGAAHDEWTVGEVPNEKN